jgi:hypothetical protein
VLRLVRTGTYDVFLAGREQREHLGRVTVGAGTRSILDCDLPRAKLSGALVDLRGDPIEGGRIRAALLSIETVEPSPDRSLVATTDEDGRFRFEDLSPGAWRVYPESSGPHGAAAIRVDLAPGAEQEVVLRSGSPTRVAGRVTRHGKSVGDARLVLSSSGSIRGSRNSEAKTNDRGSFAFDGVFPGVYELSAYVTLEANESYRRRRHVTVEDGHPLEVDFEIESAETIVAFFRQGKPFDELSGAWVFTKAGESGARSVSRQRNALALELDEGPCLLLVYSDRLPWPEGNAYSSCCYMAYVPAVAPEPSALNVEIAGAEVSVRLGEAGLELPLARLSGMGPIEHPWGKGSEPFVAFEDVSPGARRFGDVPIGARLRLESRGGAEGRISFELDIDRPFLELSWPPP